VASVILGNYENLRAKYFRSEKRCPWQVRLYFSVTGRILNAHLASEVLLCYPALEHIIFPRLIFHVHCAQSSKPCIIPGTKNILNVQRASGVGQYFPRNERPFWRDLRSTSDNTFLQVSDLFENTHPDMSTIDEMTPQGFLGLKI